MKQRLLPSVLSAVALPAAVLVLIVLTYAPSLGGDWVWDDRHQIADSGALQQPLEWMAHDVWWLSNSSSSPSTLYRPLAVLTYVPGQALIGGAGVERVINLLLHLFAVVLVAQIAQGVGAGRRAAWLGASLMGVHPGASEVVAWISARHDLLATLFVLGGWLALIRERHTLAGVLLGLAPFCKEPFLLAPLAIGCWMLATRRWALRTLLIAASGGLLYLAVRVAIDLPFPMGAAQTDGPVAALGGVALRGLALIALPGSADAAPVFTPALWAGVAILGIAGAAFATARGRPVLGALLLPLPMLLPAIPASVTSGIIGDRFFYIAFAGLAVASALAISRLWEWSPRLTPVTALLVPVIAMGTWMRAAEWVDNRSLFEASLERNADNPYAAFHLGYDYHTQEGDCERAMPLYRAATNVENRAGNNLQACLIELGRFDEAIAMGPALAQADPTRPTPATNTARALLRRQRFVEAESWARVALARDTTRAGSWVVLGQSVGYQGRHEEARDAFQRALEIDPNARKAAIGLSIAESNLESTLGDSSDG